MYGHPDAWHRLCEKLSPIVADYLVAQIEAGVDAVQVFDSWVGALERRRLPRVRAAPHAPHLRRRRTARADDSLRHRHGDDPRRAARGRRRRDRRRLAHPDRRGVGAHRRTTAASRATSIRRCCSARRARMFQQTDDILARVGGRPGHIFNLGHGILPSTPVEHVQMLAQYVHSRLAPSLACMATVDVAIVGGGIAGLAAAYELQPARPVRARPRSRRRAPAASSPPSGSTAG